MRTEKQAHAAAAKCCDTLGPGWKAKVWRSGGNWRAKVFNGPATVYIDGPMASTGTVMYWCMVSHYPDLPGCGNPEWTPVKQRMFRSPRAAVHAAAVPVFKVVKRYDMVARSCAKILEGLGTVSRKGAA